MSDLQAILANIDSKRFLAALLLDTHGAVVAQHAIKGLDTRTQQAPYHIATRVLNYPNGVSVLQTLKESIFYDMDGRRLICRVITVAQTPHLLVVLTPAESTYRRALDQLARQLSAP